jgi:hypothetical protein
MLQIFGSGLFLTPPKDAKLAKTVFVFLCRDCILTVTDSVRLKELPKKMGKKAKRKKITGLSKNGN